MRILGIGATLDLGDMYCRLQASGHEVRVFVGEPSAQDVLRGVLPRSADWRADLAWIAEAKTDGLIIFECATMGREQDGLRRDGFAVIGGCAFGDKLESDRDFAQRTLRGLGLPTAATHRFDHFDRAIEHVRATHGQWVFKLNGNGWASTRTYVGELPRGEDLIAVLQSQRDQWTFAETPDFILMQKVVGVEVGVGAYFNGENFLSPACLDWEHKRFFPGDLGELTGEMGTLVTYRDTEKFFAASLAKMQPLLAAHRYVGYINLNTIVNEAGIWPLELTCRFGYPGYAILDTLQNCGWDELLRKIVRRESLRFDTHDGWGVGVVLTTPPFPYPRGYETLCKRAPILFRQPLSVDAQDRLKLGEVDRVDGEFATAGTLGYVMVATGRGDSVEAAQTAAYELARNVVIPKMRYRNDIGDAFVARDRAALRALGWLP